MIAYSEISERWTLPSRYYAVDVEVDDTTQALFVFLDTVPLVESETEVGSDFVGQSEWNADKQFAWLDSTLAVSTAEWNLVVGHHPVISASAKHKDSSVLQDRLAPILRRREVDAYVSGHVHSLQHLRSEEGIDYVVSGGGSLARKVGTHASALFASGVSGFALFSVTPDEVRLRFIDYKGTVGYEATIVRERRAERAFDGPGRLTSAGGLTPSAESSRGPEM